MPLIFDIKRYAIHDGPGIRTTLFLKGCPLRCVWCHNPESWSPRPQRLYKRSRCIGCRTCVEACPNGALALTPEGIRPTGAPCSLCGTCARECPAAALEISGRAWPMDELMAEVEKERGVMARSGGGVTLCGGEPLLHPAYTLELLQELILDNIRLIASLGIRYFIRIPLIAGVNADAANLEASARFLASLPQKPEEVDLLPYHDIGKGKHERLGTVYNPEKIPMAAPSEEDLSRSHRIFEAFGLSVRTGA